MSGPAGAISRWPFRRDFKTALAPGREAFGIFFCPFPYPHVHTLHREGERSGARHSSKNRTFQAQARSDSLLFRNSDIRSQLAHPLSWNETRACGGPLRSDVATAEEEVRGEQLVGRSGQGPGEAAPTDKGNTVGSQGRGGARAPPRGQRRHRNCSHLRPSTREQVKTRIPQRGRRLPHPARWFCPARPGPLCVERDVFPGPGRWRPGEAGLSPECLFAGRAPGSGGHFT